MSEINNIEWAATDEELQSAPDQENLPKQKSDAPSFGPPPQPGTHYIFTVPDAPPKVSAKDIGGIQRMQAVFKEDNCLLGNPGNFRLRFQFSNSPSYEGKALVEGGKALYFLTAVGIKVENRTNAAYAAAVAKAAGRKFRADISWEATCNSEKDVRVVTELEDGTRKFETLAGIKGDGREFRLKGFTHKSGKKARQEVYEFQRNADGTYADETYYAMPDPRGGGGYLNVIIRPYPVLQNLRPVD
jgi:hypothetical protein